MNKTEFEERFGGAVTADDFSIIARVYNYHPSIPNVGGKEVIANLFMVGGLRLMNDMLPASDAAAAIETSILRANSVLSQLNGISRSLANGAIAPAHAIDMSRQLIAPLDSMPMGEPAHSVASQEVA